jgi:hypothetical protein
VRTSARCAAKDVVFATPSFDAKNRIFAKTGSGQTQEKLSKSAVSALHL